MRFKNLDVDKKWKAYALAGCVCILFFVCLTNLGKLWNVIAGFLRIMKPLFLGFVIAYIINPVAVLFRRKLFGKIGKEKLAWALSTMLALLIVLAFIVLMLSMLIPQISANVSSFVDHYPVYVLRLQNFLENKGAALGNLAIVRSLLDSLSSENGLINEIGTLITENARVIINATTGIGAAAINWFLGLVFAIYFLFEKKGFADQLSKALSLMLSSLKYQQLRILTTKFNAIFSRYIVCELVDALIIGVANYVFMAAFRMPDALFISVIVSVTNLAPTFGPIIGAAVGSFILLLEQPSAILPFLIFAVVLQSLDSYIIKPKLFGDALNVPGVLILIAIIIFGKLLGVVGMLLAIPIAAILVYIYTEAFIPWLELKKDLRAYKKEEEKSLD